MKEPSVVDVIVTIGEPNSTPDRSGDQVVRRYEEHVPIKVYAINKTGVTGTLAKWQVEAELRRIFETYPFGSFRSFERRRDLDQNLGSLTLYCTEWVFIYLRGTT